MGSKPGSTTRTQKPHSHLRTPYPEETLMGEHHVCLRPVSGPWGNGPHDTLPKCVRPDNAVGRRGPGTCLRSGNGRPYGTPGPRTPQAADPASCYRSDNHYFWTGTGLVLPGKRSSTRSMCEGRVSSDGERHSQNVGLVVTRGGLIPLILLPDLPRRNVRRDRTSSQGRGRESSGHPDHRSTVVKISGQETTEKDEPTVFGSNKTPKK